MEIESRKEDIGPNRLIYRKYMDLLKQKRAQTNHRKTIDILQKCKQDGKIPNIMIYSKVLDNCAKSLAPNMVGVKVFEEMIKQYNKYHKQCRQILRQ